MRHDKGLGSCHSVVPSEWGVIVLPQDLQDEGCLKIFIDCPDI